MPGVWAEAAGQVTPGADPVAAATEIETEFAEVTVIEMRRPRHAAQPAFVLEPDTIRETVPIALTEIFRRVHSVGTQCFLQHSLAWKAANWFLGE